MLNTVNGRGFHVDDIWIVPKNQSLQQQLLSRFSGSRNYEDAFSIFGRELDFDVWAVDLHFLDANNLIFYDVLSAE